MTKPFDVTETTALTAALMDLAHAGRTAGYAELATALQLRPPHRIHRLTIALEDRIRFDHQAGRPLLAAMAVGKFGFPGRGFFQLLTELGRYTGPDSGPEAEGHYVQEREAAISYWQDKVSD